MSSVLLFFGACSARGAAEPSNQVSQENQETVDKNGTQASKEQTSEGEKPSGESSGDSQNADSPETVSEEYVTMKAKYIQSLVDEYFLYDVSPQDYETAIYRSIMAACSDPYSCYYTPEEYQELMESTSGTYCGIGCLVSQNIKSMLITIVRPFAGSPAAIAGAKAGDIIVKVDGEDVTGMDVNLVVTKLKGVENTDVVVTVYRESSGKYIDLPMKRAFIEVETVTGEKIVQNGHKYGLITVMQFDEVTQKQFADKMNEFLDWGMEGMVVDLRDNPGGLLDVVVDMLDPLLPKGLTVYMQYRDGKKEEYKSDASCMDLPITVLVNENSASASEIFAGAVQDYNVATVIGTQSFGKGIVQRLFPLSDGSALKMTVADYYTPLGRNIHGEGIMPDIVVELPDGVNTSNLTRETDTQLQKALKVLENELSE